jgi:2-keto-4-pentenoate hydratase/2-oxohepta-3-ene-1,7-dioic acid hydratase in catechol pathway
VKLGRVLAPGPDGPEPRIIVAGAAGEPPVDLRVAERLRLERSGATPVAAARISTALVPSSMTAALAGGQAFLEVACRAAVDASGDAVLAPAEAPLIAPLDPPTFRDFMAFSEHFETAHRIGGREPPAVLYELPVSYLANDQAIIGPEDTVPWPSYTDHMDYELELGIVIGAAGRDLTPTEASAHVFGFTVLNDFSARDIQMREMSGGLGPSKGKHFASAVGPWIATAESLDATRLEMTARVNGEVWSTGSSGSITWSVAELVAWASAGEPLVVGTLLGTGTVGGGCGFELGRQLHPGDVVELEIEGIGVLRNVLGAPAPVRWTPSPKPRLTQTITSGDD